MTKARIDPASPGKGAIEARITCMGYSSSGSGQPAPTLLRRTGESPIFQLTQGIYRDGKCSYFNAREIVGDDFKGGVLGFFGGAAVGLFGGPAAPVTTVTGALAGMVGTAAVASGGTFIWQFAESVYCTATGGTAPRDRPSPT